MKTRYYPIALAAGLAVILLATYWTNIMPGRDTRNRRDQPYDRHKKNRLADSDSPYLLKHANNPVDWYEWGPEALEKAKKENKLIFLSIGYAACHWCNELEKECFDHQDFADVINKRYVSIKVDREQRPDLDQIYIQAAVAITGRGGWPNNVFLTPDLHPVYASGFQKREAFKQLLVRVDDYWKRNSDELSKTGEKLSASLKSFMERGGSFEQIDNLDINPIRSQMDLKYGGFGESSKFPITSILEFLLTEGSDDDFLRTTLDNMARGGMFDHVGGGFHRYSVDRRWQTPHFEKMLYDNALLAALYARASLLMKEPEYEYVARRTLKFIDRELSNPEGGFVSSLDADSEGKEGKFYTWTLEQVNTITGDTGFAGDYGVTEPGNIVETVVTDHGMEQARTGQNTLRLIGDDRHQESLRKLFAHRSKRTRPPLDDKVVSAWHAMAVSAFARAGVWLNEPEMIKRAEKGARFTLKKLGYSHTWRSGESSGEATLNDLAFSAMAFWDLFEATGKNEYLQSASRYVDHARKHYSAGDGGYYLVRRKQFLIARPRVTGDNPIPSSAAVLARVDLRLSTAMGDPSRAADAVKTAAHLIGVLGGASLFSGEPMILHRETSADRVEVVYAFARNESDTNRWLASGVARRWGVVRVPLGASGLDRALGQGRYPAEKTTAYVCMDNRCLSPSTTPEDISAKLKSMEMAKNNHKQSPETR